MSSCPTNKFVVMSKSVDYRSVNIINKLSKNIVDSRKKQEAVYRKTEKFIIASIILFCKWVFNLLLWSIGKSLCTIDSCHRWLLSLINLWGYICWLIQVDWFAILCICCVKRLLNNFIFIPYVLYVFVHMVVQDCSANKPTFIYYCVMFYCVVLILISESNLMNLWNTVRMYVT